MQGIRFRNIDISSDNDNYILNSIEPNEIEVDMQETKILNCDGAVYSNFTYSPRHVKVTGTICADCTDELRLLRMKLINAFDGKSLDTVYYTIDMTEYHAECIGSVTLSPPEILCQEFNISLTLPKFYWHGKTYKHHVEGISSRWVMSPLKETVPFKTEITFAVTDSDGNAVVAERIDKYIAALTETEYITLTDDTNSIKLRYIPHDGEIITVDSDEMAVSSSTYGSLGKYLIVFDKLVIKPGKTKVNYSSVGIRDFIKNNSQSIESISNFTVDIVVKYDVTYSKKYIGV